MFLGGVALWASVLFAQAEGPPSTPGFIGVMFARGTGDFPILDYVAAKSSAAEAGLKKGEEVVAINGASTRKMTPIEARHALEGEAGKTVDLTHRRKGGNEEKVSVVLRPLLETFMPAIDAGDVRADVTLGYFYEHGPAPVVDLVKAFHWYQKAADKGDAAGERSLGVLYYYGKGVPQNDKEAFAWLWSAAQQDEPRAEYYLGLMYQDGHGVKHSNRDAYYWYDRSARHDIANAQWNLAYAYEKGLGVPSNLEEALKWYQKALEGLPDNEKLRQHIAVLSLKLFVEKPETASLDPATLMPAFGKYLGPAFYICLTLYLAAGAFLLYLSFRAVDYPAGIRVAMGWLMFGLAGQVIALVVLLMAGIDLTAETLFVATCLFSAVPVIVSTLGPNRHRMWKASPASWQTLAQYAIGSYVVNFILIVGYGKIYELAAHASLPGQPTEILISKAKHGSVILAFACIALALPLAEEILFRGYFFEALKKRMPDTLVVITTAFGFALVHFQGLYFAPLFGFGLVQGWVRLKTGSLRLPVLLHVLNNGLFLAVAS